MNPFDFLKILHNKNRKWGNFSDEEKKAFNVFIVNKALSFNPDYLNLVNTTQRYTNGYLTPKEVFKVYSDFLPNRFKFYRWIKGKKDLNKELLTHLSELFETSNRESQDMVGLLSKKELREVLQTKGIEKKEITKLLKNV